MVSTEEIEKRILKDIDLFSVSMKKVNKEELSEEERKVVELSEMYASDAKAWLAKKDFYTSFSSIAYAHGLLDSILKLKHKIE